MYRYAEVERALAAAYSISEDALGAFRGRIQHLQRLGIVPGSPGRGRKISYDREAVLKWAFCIEFAEFGIDPNRIKLIVDLTWDLVQIPMQHELPFDPMMFVANPMIMSKSISSNPEWKNMPFYAGEGPKGVLIGPAELLDVKSFERAMVINLSAVRKRVDAALEALRDGGDKAV